MDSFSKTVDAFVRAPLWLFFAAAVACWIPLFNFPPLVSGGVTSSTSLAGLPLGFWALCTAAVFLSSAVARASSTVTPFVGRVFARAWLSFRLGRLSPAALTLLSVVEEDGWSTFEYDPDAPEVQELRDEELIRPKAVLRSGPPGDSRLNGGEFVLSSTFGHLIHEHPSSLRKRRAGSAEDRQQIRGRALEASGYLQWARSQASEPPRERA